MSPNGGGLPTESYCSNWKYFGSFDEFKAKFSKAGATQFDQDGFGYEKEVN
jgi:Fe-Mn family superoxide dismutase